MSQGPAVERTHVVLGANGFLGRHLVTALTERGHHVVAVDLTHPEQPGNETWIVGDCSDPELVARAVTGADVVYNLIAHVPLHRQDAAAYTANAVVPGVVARACVQAEVKQFVLVSSSAVYGLGRDGCKQPAPFEPYGTAKLAGEQAATSAVQGTGTTLAVLRPRTILGPGRGGIFSTLYSFIAEGRDVYTIGAGDRGLQFIHVDDVVAALLILGEGAEGVFDAGATEYRTLREELETLISLAGTGGRVVALPKRLSLLLLDLLYWLRLSPLSRWHTYGYAELICVDSTPLRTLGWSPAWSTEQILRDGWDHHGVTLRGGGAHTSPMKDRILLLVRKFS